MQPRITFLTLGVDDLEVALRFYREGLGLESKGIVGTQYEDGAVVFFTMTSGLVLALFPRASLAKDCGLPAGPRSPAEFSIGHNVASRAEVDAVMAQAGRAGAKMVKMAQNTFWGGYSGYFSDPDGHLWEVAWNPDFPV